MFLDAEEEQRRKQYEEEKEMRKAEQEHEVCMQRMFMGFMQQVLTMFKNPAIPYHPPGQQSGQYSQSQTPPTNPYQQAHMPPPFQLGQFDKLQTELTQTLFPPFPAPFQTQGNDGLYEQ